MLKNNERYFISNIIYPYNELINMISQNGKIDYCDNEYSPLIDKVSNLCIKILSLFEQNEFCSIHNTSKRNDLNNSDPIFHRILSYGIKAKHGKISSSYYSDFDLKLPISIFYNPDTNIYFYKYTPLIDGEDFIENFEYIIQYLIKLYSLNIKFVNNHKVIEHKILDDNTIYIEAIDNCSSRFIRTGCRSDSDSFKVEIF